MRATPGCETVTVSPMSIYSGHAPVPGAGMKAAAREAVGHRRLRVIAVATVILGLLALTLALEPGIGAGPRAAHRPSPSVPVGGHLPRPGALSPQAQLMMSGAVAATDPRYRPRPAAGGWRLTGGGITARLHGPAATFGSPAGTVGLRLAGVDAAPGSGLAGIEAAPASGLAGTEAAPGSRRAGDRGHGSLRAQGHRVIYRRGGIAEWFDSGPLGIEQGFTVARPSARSAGRRGGGTLTVALTVAGALRPVIAGRQIDFLNAAGQTALRYGALSARDASGRRLAARLVLHGRALQLVIAARGARYPVRIDPFVQEGPKFVGEANGDAFGTAVAVSADGNTALVGAPQDGGSSGAVFVFARHDGTWSQTARLVGNCTANCAHEGTGEVGTGLFGGSVALSDDGTVALIGAGNDASDAGAAWVFTQAGGTWTQQGAKLVGDCTSSCGSEGTGETGTGSFGDAVALSGNGTTAVIGAPNDNTAAGGAWVFTPSDGTWHQKGSELVGDCAANCTNEGTGEVNGGEFGGGAFGYSVASSADGSTILVGAQTDNNGDGAVWRFITGAGAYIQQGPKQIGNCFNSVCGDQGEGETSGGRFGSAVALSADGNTALVGAYQDNANTNNGAIWGFTRATAGVNAGLWSQIGDPFIPTAACTTVCGFGWNLALSADGTHGTRRRRIRRRRHPVHRRRRRADPVGPGARRQLHEQLRQRGHRRIGRQRVRPGGRPLRRRAHRPRRRPRRQSQRGHRLRRDVGVRATGARELHAPADHRPARGREHPGLLARHLDEQSDRLRLPVEPRRRCRSPGRRSARTR